MGWVPLGWCPPVCALECSGRRSCGAGHSGGHESGGGGGGARTHLAHVSAGVPRRELKVLDTWPTRELVQLTPSII